MFNWLLGKHNLIPKDVKKGMLTSLFSTFKVGENIEIPENIVCLIRYKDKTYKELTAGNHALNKEFLLDLYTKQLKNKTKIKTLKADFYFINLNNFNVEFEYATKLNINKIKSKVLFNIKTNINVVNSKTFSNFILYENNAANTIITEQILKEYLNILCKQFFLKQPISNLPINNEIKQELFSFIYKNMLKIGVNVNDLQISLFKEASEKIVTKPTTSNFFSSSESNEINKNSELKQINTNNPVDQPEKNIYTENKDICPRCKCKFIKGSIFCHRCGYRR